MHYYLEAFKKINLYEGRSNVREFWYFMLFHILVYIVLLLLSSVTGSYFLIVCYLMYSFASLLPLISLSVRRLHDTNRSGIWLLIIFIPFGIIPLFIFLSEDSEPDENGVAKEGV